LIEQGANLDTQDAAGDTSLIIAIRHNNKATLQLSSRYLMVAFK
jgi:ankyrin repeat protein